MQMNARKPEQRAVIAILTMDDETKGFRGNPRNFIDLIRTGKEMDALVYVTIPRHLHHRLHNRTIPGYTYDFDKERWIEGTFPQPHVVYNRIPNYKDESLPLVQQTIQACLQHPRIHFFNPGFFNKWTLCQWLYSSKKARTYVPATQKLSSGEQLGRMLIKHPVIYLKPMRGKAGLGIMKVERKTKPLNYTLVIQQNKKIRRYKFSGRQELWDKFMGQSVSEPYIAQQGISKVSFNNRPFDLRVLVQKDGGGDWKVTGIGARVAGSVSITTHVPRGGSIEDPEKVLQAVFGIDKAKTILKETKLSALGIAKTIERKSGHTLGEMSMDLGVDMTGKLWFFEANSKPMKFDEPHIRDKSLRRIIQYCIFLAKRKQTKHAGSR